MTIEGVVLVGVASAFAVISGANDGGALLAVSLNLPAIRPLAAAALLATTIVLGALVLGTEVATTLATRLVAFDTGSSVYALPSAVGAAVGVVAVLSRLGLPTSLTLALIGGIAGAGIGFGLTVSWGTIGYVLAIAALAPAVGLLGAILLLRLLAHAPAGGALRRVRWAHRGAFGLLCLAYSINDGQKMLAIFAIAFGTATPIVAPDVRQLLLIAVLFVIGMLLGLRRIAKTLGSKVVTPRPVNVVTAETAAAAAVLGSSALGAPVSITQSITGGLVGAGISSGYQRVRWNTAGQIGIAWLVTLPAAAAAAAFAGGLLRGLGT